LARSRAFTADRYIGVSRFVCERFVAVGGLPAERCAAVHNGIEPIGRSPAQRGYAARHFPIPDGAPIVVSTGRATWYKGVDFLIRCAERVPTGVGPAPVFLHVGDGPDLAEFRRIADAAGLGGRFLLAGRRDDVREILPSCDVALHASRGEAFSLSILEYLSAGLATLAPGHCGNGEAIRDGVDGLLYRPGDLDGAVRALARLLADPALRARLGASGMQRVEEHFTLERATRAFRDEIAGAL
jgi:glycosyltransferase involved in cell wall biosynthesis